MMHEGIRDLPNMAPRINRTQKVEHLLWISAASRIVLICSAPTTGKTVLMQLLEDHLHAHGHQYGKLPITDTRLRKDGGVKEGAETFDEYFARSVGRS
jgi:type II secretory pathway predicted ATPase ExeA